MTKEQERAGRILDRIVLTLIWLAGCMFLILALKLATGKAHGQASQFFSFKTTTTNYTVKLTDFYIAATANCTNTLPAANTTRRGQSFAVKEVAGTNVVTVRLTGSDTIDLTTGDDLVTSQRCTIYISDGASNYHRVFMGLNNLIEGIGPPVAAPVNQKQRWDYWDQTSGINYTWNTVTLAWE